MLRFDDVRLKQGDFELSLDWAVGPGFTAVVGPSGSGKSTLLAAIAGFLQPVSGDILWRDASLLSMPPARRPVGILFQDNNLFPHLTLFQNVGLGLAPQLRLSEPQSKQVENVLERVGLSGLMDSRPGEVSGGQQSRAALARALIQERPVVCLDEPFAALGPGQRQEMLALAAEMLAGRTVLLVTHDPQEARGFAEDAIFVDGGIAAAPTRFETLLDDPLPALARYLRR